MKMNLIEMEGFLSGKCLPGDMKVNETNAQYLVRKISAMHAYRIEPEDQCKALAAENAGLKSKGRELLWEACAVYAKLNKLIDPTIGDFVDGQTLHEFQFVLDVKTPATDRFIAEVNREAVIALEKQIKQLRAMSVGDLRDLIDYNPNTGKLTAKVNFSCRQAGSAIGSTTKHGYCVLSLFGKKYFAHRLAWLLHYGELPDMAIDHINGIKTDNRIENLRLCTLSQNQFNRPTQKNNSTGVKGVYWNKRDKRYVASAQFNGKKHSAGRHKDIGAAKQAVIDLREQLAGEFANHGEYELAQQLRETK